MADTSAPAPTPPGLSNPRRVRRWPTAAVTCLLTLAAAYLLERYVLPTQGWWVAHNRTRHHTDGHYLDEVLHSKSLPPETKVYLIADVIGVNSASVPFTAARDQFRGWRAERGAALVEVVAAVLGNPNADDASLVTALLLLQTAAELGHAKDLPEQQVGGVRLAINDKAGPALYQLTTRPGVSADVRSQAVVAWACVGTPRFHTKDGVDYVFPTDALIASLSDADEGVRAYAARALGFTANWKETPTAVAALLKRLDEEPAAPRSDGRSPGRPLTFAAERFHTYDY